MQIKSFMKFSITSLLALSVFAALNANEINLYSHRHYDTDKAIFAKFTEKTGIKVNVVQAKANELIERLKSEGANTKADVFLTADAGNLEAVRNMGMFEGFSTPTLEGLSQKHLRGPDNGWYAIAIRARIIAYSTDRVKAGAIKNYEDLTKKELKGKVLSRSSNHVYSRSLLSSMIESVGKDKAKEWAKGVVANFARDPKGSDRDQIRAIYAKQADVALSNSYYIGLMLNSPEENDVKAAKSITVVFPNQDNRGTHFNVSGVGLIKYSKNRDNAIKFIEFMLSPEAQTMITNSNYEFPANKDVEPAETIKAWGKFKLEKTDFVPYFKNVGEATKIFDEVGWK